MSTPPPPLPPLQPLATITDPLSGGRLTLQRRDGYRSLLVTVELDGRSSSILLGPGAIEGLSTTLAEWVQGFPR